MIEFADEDLEMMRDFVGVGMAGMKAQDFMSITAGMMRDETLAQGLFGVLQLRYEGAVALAL